MRELILHIGAHRTGSTALQMALHQHRSVLATAGYCYPGDDVNHQRMAWDILAGRLDSAQFRGLIEQEDLPTIILSAEDFCIHRDLGWLEELSSSFRVSVHFYIRRQDDWIMSWYNQHVKWPFSRRHSAMDAQSFLNSIGEFYWIDYYATAVRWRDVVGSDNIHVRVVQPGEVEDVVADFARIFSTETAAVLSGSGQAERKENDSLPVAAIETARHLGLIDLPGTQRSRVVEALRRAFADTDYRTLYSAVERRRILERFRSSNERLATEFLGRQQLFDDSTIDDKGYLDLRVHPEFSMERSIQRVIKALVSRQ